jgi:hypothetical protein
LNAVESRVRDSTSGGKKRGFGGPNPVPVLSHRPELLSLVVQERDGELTNTGEREESNRDEAVTDFDERDRERITREMRLRICLFERAASRSSSCSGTPRRISERL